MSSQILNQCQQYDSPPTWFLISVGIFIVVVFGLFVFVLWKGATA